MEEVVLSYTLLVCSVVVWMLPYTLQGCGTVIWILPYTLLMCSDVIWILPYTLLVCGSVSLDVTLYFASVWYCNLLCYLILC